MCCHLAQEISTWSCHRGSGKSCLRSVHLGRLCVPFHPAAGSSAQPRSVYNAQTLHLNEVLREPPLCSECYPCKRRFVLIYHF